MTRRSVLGVVFLLSGIHVLLSLHTAWQKSPVWDEIVYPAAGYDLWKTGRIHLNTDHPPLGKALLALPLLPFQRVITHEPATGPGADPFRYGFHFTYENRFPSLRLTFLPRLTSLGFSIGLGLLIFFFVRRRWGDPSACLSLAIVWLSPAVLARASLALLEMPLAFFMTATWMVFVDWLERPTHGRLAAWTALWICALLVKTTAIVLFPVFLLAAIATVSGEPRRAWGKMGWLLLGVVVAVGFSELMTRALGSNYIGTQWLGRGGSYFVQKFPVYFHGQVLERARWYFGVSAWLIKTPIPVMLLAGWGLKRWRDSKTQEAALGVVLGLALVGLCLMLAVRSIIATTHYFYLYPVLAVMAAPLLAAPVRRSVSGGAFLLIAWLVVATAWNHPDHLAYANEWVGGTKNGSAWLWDSDQDWGQDLGTLARWMKSKSIPAVLLGYSGAGDPRAYGIHYQDVLSPALVTAVYRGERVQDWPQGIFLVLSAKVFQSEPLWTGWLTAHRQPVARLGGTLLIFDLTQDPEATAWLTDLYEKSGRPALAYSFRQRSRRILHE